ncbi:hypothetical protein M2323_004486 [Rhodoblastus acidophilus]|uniref:DUF1488 domain-containing protein n=1 Tax=Rhodoblastus acidophilus TaxID=1074 RepID=UPI0016156691|nr:DUF1488 domain-containing protein [Rhodoblastus acidophilus]MCW2286717.1 hypothetical protein [Rhodoblastus acidophilus]MCW2335537.1 hypothetical protein [Rhodoblastus acidophilus]
MTLAFLNPSRTFDEARNAVSFFGHDGMFEIRFWVEAAALASRQPRGTEMSEAECLSAFDAMLSSIHDAARAVYFRRRSNLNTLRVTDFR